MTDIVERLRRYPGYGPVIEEAVDEIERLRSENSALREANAMMREREALRREISK